MKRIKIAQIGTSRYSHGFSAWRSLLKQSDIFDVVGYALPEGEREKFSDLMHRFDGGREMTVEEILSDPEIEAVAVETEEIYLTKYALMVAKAGKHLYMEKPGSPNIADFEALVNILKEKKLAFGLGYMYRFNPKIKEVLERVKRGDLGKIYSVEAQLNCKHDAVCRAWLEKFPGGMLFFLGCHLIDLIYQIQGEPSEVIPLSCSTGIEGVNTQDFGMAVYKYPNGVSFAKTCDDELGGVMRRQLVITGELGTVEIRPLEASCVGGQYTGYRECFDSSWGANGEEGRTEPYDRYDDMLRNFAEMVRGKENPYDYDYELRLFKLIMRSCGINE